MAAIFDHFMQTISGLFKAPYWCALFVTLYAVSMCVYPAAACYRCKAYLLEVRHHCPQWHDPPYKSSESLMMFFPFIIVVTVIVVSLIANGRWALFAILVFYSLSLILVRCASHNIRHKFWQKQLAKHGVPESKLKLEFKLW